MIRCLWAYWISYTLKRAMAADYEPFAKTSMYIIRRWWGFQYVPRAKVVAYCHELRIAREALEKIADPRKRDHQEPDAYTQLGCVMNLADEALQKIEAGLKAHA